MRAIYLDSAYIAKCYLNEPDSEAVLELVESAEIVCSSEWCLAEMATILHRQVRERVLSRERALELQSIFLAHVAEGAWALLAVSRELLEEVLNGIRLLPGNIFLRAGDALHLVTARRADFSEIWTNDRHLLDAARYFGLTGRSV